MMGDDRPSPFVRFGHGRFADRVIPFSPSRTGPLGGRRCPSSPLLLSKNASCLGGKLGRRIMTDGRARFPPFMDGEHDVAFMIRIGFLVVCSYIAWTIVSMGLLTFNGR
jgi:hypothetical protein